MSQERRPSSDVAILLGGGVREALMAQSVLRACEGATVFVSADAIGTVLGIPSRSSVEVRAELRRSLTCGFSVETMGFEPTTPCLQSSTEGVRRVTLSVPT